MDPNAILIQILEHIAEGERKGAMDALDVLRDWLLGGGVMPEKAARSFFNWSRQETILRLTGEIREKLDEIDPIVS